MKKRSSKDQKLLEQLEELAEKLGLKVRYEPIKKEGSFFPGGLCRVKEENLLIINSKASSEDKINAFVEALGYFDLNNIFMLPAIRDLFKLAPEDRSPDLSEEK